MMRKTFALLITTLFTFSALAEESKSYTQFDTFRFTVNNQDAKKFTKNMRNHIKKYHTKGMLKTKIYNVLYGESANDLIWVMGPVSFSELDARPDNKKHDDDWADNINPYIASYNQSEVWRNMEGLTINNMDKNEASPEKFISRYLTINPDVESDVVKFILKQIKNTIEKSGKVKYWTVMENQFIQGKHNGRHLMALSSIDTLAKLDEDMEFAKHFEELHGKGSFKVFVTNYDNMIENHWQEVIEVNKEMSGM